jgi:hypothetical protein
MINFPVLNGNDTLVYLYLWIFSFLCFMFILLPVPHLHDYSSFVVVFEIDKCEFSYLILLFYILYWLFRFPSIFI